MTITLPANSIQLLISDKQKYTEWLKLQTTALEKKGGYLTCTVELPKRPRTTGEGSQNSHIHGHCGNIAEQLNMDKEHVYEAIKRMAVGTFGYPTWLNPMDGKEEPLPQHYASVEQASLLIEMCHHFADSNRLWLMETVDGRAVKTLNGKEMKL